MGGIANTDSLHNINTNNNDNNSFNCLPRFYLLNATSIAKCNAKQHLVADFSNFNSDVVLVVETWLNKSHNSNELAIDHYCLFRRDRCGKRKGGGLCAYVKNHIDCQVIVPDSEMDSNLEIMWLSLNCKDVQFFVCLCYHPPKPVYHPSLFTTQLSRDIDFIDSTFNSVFIVIAGDFNSLDTQFISTGHGLTQMVNQSTHCNNIIDKFFITRPDLYHCYTVKSIVKTKHRAVIASPSTSDMNLNGSASQVKRKCIVYDTRQHNIDRLRFFLGTFDWSPLYDIVSLDELYDTFVTTVKYCIRQCIPTKTVTLRQSEPYYITPLVKSLLRERNKFRRKGRLPEAEKVGDRINKIIHDLQQTRLGQLSSSNTSKLWKAVRSVSGKVGCPQIDTVLNQPIDGINQFFANISTTNEYNSDLIESQINNIAVSQISSDEISPFIIEKLLRTMKNTAAGYDEINSWVFKSCSYELAEITAYIINRSIVTGQVPSNWLKAIVTPVPKVSNPKSIAEFRPISVTPILSRVTEKLIVSRWLKPAMPPDTLRNQFAYKPTGSTSCALIQMIHHITEAFNRGNNYVRVLIIDFSKAFDTVDHLIIIRKINELDMPPNIKNWLISFLRNRSQITKINGTHSNCAKINRGVVQGSALGPFLFLLLLSDLDALSLLNLYVKYADDLFIIVPEHSDTELNSEFINVKNFALLKKLMINFVKTKELIFWRTIPDNNILQCLTEIELITDCKLLGIQIDNRLLFDKHMSSILSACSQRFYLLKLLKNQGMSISCLSNIFNSIIVGKIEYCLSAWGGFLKEAHIDKVNSLFRKAKRYGYTDTIYDIRGLLMHFDNSLFDKMRTNENHCLRHLLPDPQENDRNFRTRGHCYPLPLCTAGVFRKSFLPRVLYSLK